jgi:hypothetical protein
MLCRLPDPQVCWTEWGNLQKRADMDVGTIGFKDTKGRKLYRNIKTNKEVRGSAGIYLACQQVY